MSSGREIRKFGLYGEGNSAGSPEFVHIETISARSRLHNWSISPHVHPNIFQLMQLIDGGGILAVDGAEIMLQPPVLVIVPCGCVHAFRFEPDTKGWVLSVADALVADGRLGPIDVASTVQGSQVMHIPLDDARGSSDLMAHALTELTVRHESAPGVLSNAAISIVGLVLSLAEELAQERAARLEVGQDRRVSLVRRFGKLVEVHMREQWSVERYAEELGTTAPTLTRACREVVNRAPAQMVQDRRLREAKRALSYTDASVSMISDDLGFADPAYFARVFKQQIGVTASAFRKERFWAA
jgi:AraC family transcriptional activator of pobA